MPLFSSEPMWTSCCGIADGQRAQHEGVEQAEDCAVSTDTEAKRKNGRKREEGAFIERSASEGKLAGDFGKCA